MYIPLQEEQKLPYKELSCYIPSASPQMSLNRKTMNLLLFLKKIIEKATLYLIKRKSAFYKGSFSKFILKVSF